MPLIRVFAAHAESTFVASSALLFRQVAPKYFDGFSDIKMQPDVHQHATEDDDRVGVELQKAAK